MTVDPIPGNNDFDQKSQRQNLYQSFQSDQPPETYLKNVDQPAGVSIHESDASRKSFEKPPLELDMLSDLKKSIV